MIVVGIVLLSKNNKYVNKDGELPSRPDFDKAMLLNIIRDNTCICSPNTYASLPKSMTKEDILVMDNPWKLEMLKLELQDKYLETKSPEFLINLGISTFKLLEPSVFYVVRSDKDIADGKDFDIEWLNRNFKAIYQSKNLEIYHRIT